jgi:IclR family acetate operon transcriptional repressor
MKGKDGRYNIRVLDRAFRVLSLLSDGNPRTLTELSGALEINSSTMFRLLATLSSHNYVQRNERTGEYRLGLAPLELTRAYFEGNDIRRNALPELEILRDDTTETVHLGVLDRMEVVYLEKLHGLHAIGLMSSRVGGRSPSHCTGLGKVLLAYLDPQIVQNYFEEQGLKSYTERTISDLDQLMIHLGDVRRKGFALDLGEHEAEVRCVAAPLFGISGKVVAAISVSGPAARLESLVDKDELIGKTIEAAQAISRKLGFNSPRQQAGSYNLGVEET